MKSKFILSGLAALAFAASAHAVNIVNVTGATAFRAAAVDTIIAAYGAGLTGVAHNGTAGTLASLRGASMSIFRGNLPGGSGDTIIRATWTGSVEGIRDVAVPQNQNFLTTATLTSTGTAYTGPNGVTARFGVSATQAASVKFGFSDSHVATSPYDVSGLTAEDAGIIVFVPVANKSAVGSSLTNTTTQSLRATFGAGFQPLSTFTGVATDTIPVYAMGRSDLSGTRTTYLAEMGYGASNLVQQYKPTTTGSVPSVVCTTLQNWPVGDGVNASTVWHADAAGNGGFQSGGTVAAAMAAATTSVQVKNSAGTNVGAPKALYYISVLGFADAFTAVGTNGGKALAYNGVSITPAASLSGADRVKVTTGAYTMWAAEQFFYSGDLSTGDDQAFYDAIHNNLGTNLGTAGVPMSEMTAARGDDGGTVLQ
jgi:hypothetical protein